MVVVGTPANEEQARAVTHPGRTRQVFAGLFSKLEATRTSRQVIRGAKPSERS